MFATLGYYICIPFAALLRLFYNVTGSYGVSLILFTLVIKLVMLPFQMKSKKGMMRMSRMSGKLKDLQTRYKNNQQKYAEEVQKLYAEEGVSPMGGCLWSFLPLPIMIALYSIIRSPITHFMNLGGLAAGSSMLAAAKEAISAAGLQLTSNAVYEQIELVKVIGTNADKAPIASFLSQHTSWIYMDYNFLGLDLTATPSQHMGDFSAGISWGLIGLMLIPIFSGALSFLLSRITMSSQPATDPNAARSTKMMTWMMPLMSVYIGFIMPAALGVYWIAQSLFSILQEYLLGKFYNKKLEEEEEAKEAQRAELRRQRQEEAKQQAQLQRELNAANQNKKKIAAKRAEKLEKKAKEKPRTNENGRVGDRPYARGRTFSEDHYKD
ncbi:YidC/Oxa1 family membrane protein insertase [Oscillibacter sp. MSJ-2]|uniref:YidC/Oxa1 family membrane protein insertase n=1 Tax=Dysosmobacter acutus TaxID=2841504 RepID=A0ABS6F661_9FIRM|nr:YidC/Oxa1 family membrane protein insertase [Dysosmobacter acutus]MBU5625755.1 YidC/Oxa1 family membrane protein insertase [Dysosmobacter acutus]